MKARPLASEQTRGTWPCRRRGSPSTRPTIRPASAGVVDGEGGLRDPGSDARDQGGGGRVGKGLATDLPASVVAPAPERAVGFQGAGAISAGRQLNQAGAGGSHLHRRSLALPGAVAELTLGIVAPTPERAIACQDADMVPAHRHLDHRTAKLALSRFPASIARFLPSWRIHCTHPSAVARGVGG